MSTQAGLFVHLASGNVGIGTTMPMAAFHVAGDTMSGSGGYPYYATLGTSNVVNPPSSSGTINGVNITALNKRTRTSYASAVNCVSTWTTRTSAADNNWRSVCWAPELSLFVAVAEFGTLFDNQVMTSPDGINWTIRTSAANNQWLSVCWSPELSLFVAVARSGTGNRVMTSPNGINWTIRTSAADNSWASVCWAPELSLFVAVAQSGTGNRVMTSPNGITWTARASAADNSWLFVCWAPELSIFVAVAGSGTGNRVMTSPDGITWTARTSAVDNTWRSVCWAPELSLFVAVASSGTGNRVMTSQDGITWTAGTSAADNNWISVCWAPELSLFVAVAQSGTGDRVMTSPNGITWTARMSAADNSWLSVCWSPELSIFVAVAESGTGNRVMTSAIGMPNSKSVVKALPSQMTVLPNGNVGIGVSNPESLVQVSGKIISPSIGGPGGNWFAITNGAGSAGIDLRGDNLLLNKNYGWVGIGNTNPSCPLDVVGNATINLTGGYYLVPGGTGSFAAGNQTISIKCNYYMWSQLGFLASSDTRIKTNIQDINDETALAQLRLLQPKTYEYIDKVQRGSDPVIGFIAQEVAEVIPRAVTKQKEIIPSVYAIASVTDGTLNLEKEHGFVVGDTIKLILEEVADELITKVKEIITPMSFTIEDTLQDSRVFVYGKEVPDFHTLDKNAIFTIGVAAVQELDRQVQQLRTENAAILERLAAIEQRLP